jgi:zinc D-Ala-D-Ala dipeptidase
MTLPVTLIADPKVVQRPIEECGEPLVDLRAVADRGGLNVDGRKQDDAGLWLHARVGIIDRLWRAQAAAPGGVSLLVVEAYRPVELQRFYFERYVTELQEKHPTWDRKRLHALASRYVAPPDLVPPHSTGGAVDLTLVESSGVELDLGTPVNASPEQSRGACFTAAPNLTFEAKSNRTLLCRLMEGAGFVNYATEWWHWSYGDRYWAHKAGSAVAIYGTVTTRDEASETAVPDRGGRLRLD